MNRFIRIDLHCHSSLSDGQLPPAQVAEQLAAAGVVYAALADHDTLQGLKSFRLAARRLGVGCIDAVELTTYHQGQELHLLAYGFDCDHPTLLTTLHEIRQFRQTEMHSIARSLRNQPTHDHGAPVTSLVQHGRLDTHSAIQIIHEAGGKAFFAHPLFFEKDLDSLRVLLAELKSAGLDGIEAIYGPYNSELQQVLKALAEEVGLLISGGTDLHESTDTPGVKMPHEQWKAFRDSLLSGRCQKTGPSSVSPSLHRRQWLDFAFHIILPSLLALGLFIGTVFLLILPTLEKALLERKREMIRELTNSAWSILAEAENEVQNGQISREKAQELAKQRIASMRYGREGKDYFWLQDLHPRIVMHPYRQDLIDQDVSDFKDARGVRIFSEFADMVRRREQGYIEYVWQWKDDPARLVPKESYIRGFEPWGWIIGTGIYIEDVQEEIGRIEQNLVRACLVITVIVALLLAWVMRESLLIERDRQDFEEHLRESTERYRALVELANEGTLLVLNHRCRYANPLMLNLLGCTSEDLELLDLTDVLPPEDNHPVWETIHRLFDGEILDADHEGMLCRRDGSLVACEIALRTIESGGTSGLVLLAHSLEDTTPDQADDQILLDRIRSLPGSVAVNLTDQILNAPSAHQIIDLCHKTDSLVRLQLDCGAHPHLIAGLVAGVCDAATRRLVLLAEEEFGPPPARYTFMALGSQGRQEQTLFTDQDNAILYEGPWNEEKGRYFQQMGEGVCNYLHEAGYSFCQGKVMAKTPRWCQPVEVWESCFGQWIRKAEPQELLDFSIFFDLRCVYGEQALVQNLRHHIDQLIRDTPAFLPHFAQHALHFKPPLGLFGRIVTGGTVGDHPGMLDLKAAMMPLVSFARLYALGYEIHANSTMDRLSCLKDKGLLLPSSYNEIITAFDSLLRLRLRNQVATLGLGNPHSNLFDPNSLGRIERAILKESFAEIEALQKRISFDFLGGQ